MSEIITTTEDVQIARENAAFEMLQRQAKMFSASTLVPKEFQGNLANCAIGINIAKRLGADPFMVLQNIDIIHGRPSFRATFLIAMVNSAGRFEPLQFRMEGEEGKPSRSCVAWTKSKPEGTPLEGPKITLEMAKAEGWSTKNGSKWLTMPELMLRYRAAAFFARLYAPDITLGMHTSDELQDLPHEREVTPKRTAARAVPLDPFKPAAIEDPPEDVEQVEVNPVFDDFLLSLADVNTAADLESYRVQCAEFEKESERTIAHAAVEKQAESLGLKWNGADYATA